MTTIKGIIKTAKTVIIEEPIEIQHCGSLNQACIEIKISKRRYHLGIKTERERFINDYKLKPEPVI